MNCYKEVLQGLLDKIETPKPEQSWWGGGAGLLGFRPATLCKSYNFVLACGICRSLVEPSLRHPGRWCNHWQQFGQPVEGLADQTWVEGGHSLDTLSLNHRSTSSLGTYVVTAPHLWCFLVRFPRSSHHKHAISLTSQTS